MSLENIAENRFKYIAKTSKRIALICHRKPDCDTIGSMLGLFMGFSQDSSKKVSLFSIDASPTQLSFMPHIEELKPLKTFNPTQFDVVITLDCGDFCQTGFQELHIRRSSLPVVVNIDHHGNELFGDLNIIDTSSSSTAEIVYKLLKNSGYEITKDIATCLFSGIIQDTDNFKNPNTSIETFETTSALLAKGVNIKKVGAHLNFNRSLNSLKAWGKILSRAKKHTSLNVVTTYITSEDMEIFSTNREGIEGVANFLNSMPDVKAACVLIEDGNGEIKGSLRTLSDSIDVSKLAQYFGGGGHRRAAGFSIPGTISEESGKLTIRA